MGGVGDPALTVWLGKLGELKEDGRNKKSNQGQG
jgi:hypothetical protein